MWFPTPLWGVLCHHSCQGLSTTGRNVFVNVWLIGYNWAFTRENLFWGFVNSKSADHPAHLRRLISTFAVRLLQRIISRLAISEISFF